MRVSRFCNIPLDQLDERLLWALDSTLPHLEAIEELRQREIESPITPERLKYLLILKTGDEDFADKQAAKLLLAELTQ